MYVVWCRCVRPGGSADHVRARWSNADNADRASRGVARAEGRFLIAC